MRAKVDAQGRILVPAELRRELGFEPGVVVSVRIVDGELRVITIDAAIKRLQGTVQKYTKGKKGLVDEFLAERRAEAARE